MDYHLCGQGAGGTIVSHSHLALTQIKEKVHLQLHKHLLIQSLAGGGNSLGSIRISEGGTFHVFSLVQSVSILQQLVE